MSELQGILLRFKQQSGNKTLTLFDLVKQVFPDADAGFLHRYTRVAEREMEREANDRRRKFLQAEAEETA